MPHTYNRRAFSTFDKTSPLVRLYAGLVALELRLKDEAPTWRPGHDVEGLARSGRYSPTIETHASNLMREVAALACTDRQGGPSVVASQYPNLRYLRHVSDFGTGSSEADLERALEIFDDLLDELGALC